MDCMDAMKGFPDGFFDLAIVDPPYGMDITGRHVVSGDGSKIVGGGHGLSAVTMKAPSASAKSRLNFTTPSTTRSRRTKAILRSCEGLAKTA